MFGLEGLQHGVDFDDCFVSDDVRSTGLELAFALLADDQQNAMVRELFERGLLGRLSTQASRIQSLPVAHCVPMHASGQSRA